MMPQIVLGCSQPAHIMEHSLLVLVDNHTASQASNSTVARLAGTRLD
jgi:hypothetical protein